MPFSFKRWPHTLVSKLHPGRRGICLSSNLPVSPGPCSAFQVLEHKSQLWISLVCFLLLHALVMVGKLGTAASSLLDLGRAWCSQAEPKSGSVWPSLHPCSVHPWERQPYIQPPADTGLTFQSILRLNSHKLFTFIKRQNCFLHLIECERHSCL